MVTAACASVRAPGAAPEANIAASIAADLATYVAFGEKRAGGAGDSACGAWIEARLAALGFETQRQTIPAIAIEERDPRLIVGGRNLELGFHDLGRSQTPDSLHAPLALWTPHAYDVRDARGAIVVTHLASRRWSSAAHPDISSVIAHAFGAGAAALILVMHGPTSELIRLNRPMQNGDGPVLLLAPRVWSESNVSVLTNEGATLALNATQSAREAFNVIGRLDRGAQRWVVVSTPRSGWGLCAGERGPGIAAFLALAHWAPRLLPRHNIVFVCTSSHEFENAGGAAFIANGAPHPEETALWLHLGAGFAARDWHEAGARLSPLPSADPQRFLVTSQNLIEDARRSFAGVAGLETPYPPSAGAAGELGNILAAGYPSVAGLFGAHRFHHVAQDDMRCVEPIHTTEIVDRLRRLLNAPALF